MTITVTSVASAASSTQASSGGGSQDGVDGLFASMLGIQLGGLGGSSLVGGSSLASTSLTSDDKAASTGKTKSDKDSDSDSASTDSSNLLLQSIPLLQSSLLPSVQGQANNMKNPTTDDAAGQSTSTLGASQSADAALQASLDAQSALAAEKLTSTPLVKNNNGQQAQKLPVDDSNFAQFLPQTTDATAAANANQAANQASAAKSLSISQPITDPAWTKALGDQVLSMVSLRMDKATIQVNPPQLGPVEVSLKMNGNDQAQVIFTSAVPATREILENNMPKLASMMASNGIALADAQVSSGQSGYRQQQSNQNQSGRRQNAANADEDDTLTAIKAARGILSIFA